MLCNSSFSTDPTRSLTIELDESPTAGSSEDTSESVATLPVAGFVDSGLVTLLTYADVG